MSTTLPLRMHLTVARLRLKAPFRISGYTFTEVPVAQVTLESSGLRGRGEAAGVYYLKDTPDRIADTIESLRSKIEAGINRTQLHDLLPIGGARNALDCALWELEAQRAGRTVMQLAGIDHAMPRRTTFTLSADPPADVARAARALPDARALKLKLDGNVDADIERVLAVRSARPDVWIGVDANQGYTQATLATVLPVFVASRVELVEQPVARGNEAALDGFTSPIPLAADESVQGVADIAALVGRFQVVNIKLDKCGGLTEALAMVAEARRLGLKVMVGNMVGTSLARAPAYVVAQRCDFVDLDGPCFLRNDVQPGVTYEGGSVCCADAVWGGARAA